MWVRATEAGTAAGEHNVQGTPLQECRFSRLCDQRTRGGVMEGAMPSLVHTLRGSAMTAPLRLWLQSWASWGIVHVTVGQHSQGGRVVQQQSVAPISRAKASRDCR